MKPGPKRSQAAVRAVLDVRPIDAAFLQRAAETGQYHAVSDGEQFAVVRLAAGGWLFPGGASLEFVPTEYLA